MNKKILLLIISILILAIPVCGQPTNIKLIIQKSIENNIFIAYLEVTPGTNIAGMQTNIKFDPSVISINSIKQGNLFSKNVCPTIFNKGILDNKNGTVVNIYEALLCKQYINNTGIFIVVHGIYKNDEIILLDLYNTRISNQNGESVEFFYDKEILYIEAPVMNTISKITSTINTTSIITLNTPQLITSDGLYEYMSKTFPVYIKQQTYTIPKNNTLNLNNNITNLNDNTSINNILTNIFSYYDKN